MNAPPAMRAGPVIPCILTSRYHEDPDPATMQRPSCQPRVCIAKETAESDSAFENRDALDVMGHGEDVERPQGSHGVAAPWLEPGHDRLDQGVRRRLVHLPEPVR